MTAYFNVHFDGEIAINHRLPVRVLGKTYTSMQAAIDRAYLINTYGNVSKFAKLKSKQYSETSFTALYPREGGIWLDSLKDNAERIIDTINNTIAPIYNLARQRGLENVQTLSGQISNEIDRARNLQLRIPHFNEWSLERRDEWANLYSHRSIAKEIDQLISPIAIKNVYNSIVEIQLHGSQSYPIYSFDKSTARNFHRIVANRELGPPVRIDVKVTVLDRGHRDRSPGSKAENINNGLEFILHIPKTRTEDYNMIDSVHQIHNGGNYQIYAAPIMESGGFDVQRGDYVFLGIVNG